MPLDPNAIAIGPGLLYIAPVATLDPTTGASGTLPSAWEQIGYTEEGTTFRWETTTEPIEVAESLEPVRYEMTRRTGTVAFAMAEATRRNLLIALNAGLTSGTTDPVEPNDIGTEVRVKLLHRTEDGAQWLFRQCLVGGTVELRNQKAPNKKLIGVEFNLEKPTSDKHWKVWPNANSLI